MRIRYKWLTFDKKSIPFGLDQDHNNVWLDCDFETPEEANKNLVSFLDKVMYFDKELILVVEVFVNNRV